MGAWEPPGAEGSTSSSVSQQSGSAGLSTDAQVWQPPSLPRQQSMDSGGQSLRGSAEFYPSGANGSAQQHRKWVDPAAAAYYQESLAEDAATGAEMRGGLLVVESSAGPGDGADPPHYGGFSTRNSTAPDQISHLMVRTHTNHTTFCRRTAHTSSTRAISTATKRHTTTLMALWRSPTRSHLSTGRRQRSTCTHQRVHPRQPRSRSNRRRSCTARAAPCTRCQVQGQQHHR